MMRFLAILGLLFASATVIGLVLADDGMATCQSRDHSFDVCHDAIY